jgi:hypothetical protein
MPMLWRRIIGQRGNRFITGKLSSTAITDDELNLGETRNLAILYTNMLLEASPPSSPNAGQGVGGLGPTRSTLESRSPFFASAATVARGEESR